VLDAADADELAAFYQRLLGGSISSDEPGWVVLRSSDAGLTLGFAGDAGYTPPVWPNQDDHQQMMLHLDLLVDDLDEGTEHAVAAGARVAEHQPQTDVRVMLDPAGHPFCLWVETVEPVET